MQFRAFCNTFDLHYGGLYRVLGIHDICHFTCRDIEYYPLYSQGYGILCSIFWLLSEIFSKSLYKTATLKKTKKLVFKTNDRLKRSKVALLSTFIKLPFVIKIFVLSIFEWPFYTGFTLHVFLINSFSEPL